ncbi:hypothetical protein J6590_089038 [Homalodisca vitripennis]|nr:hypothetical protein J6590_089038 [Homalodisca vitripennis]
MEEEVVFWRKLINTSLLVVLTQKEESSYLQCDIKWIRRGLKNLVLPGSDDHTRCTEPLIVDDSGLIFSAKVGAGGLDFVHHSNLFSIMVLTDLTGQMSL